VDMTSSAEQLPRRAIGSTGLTTMPVAVDGSVFGWAAGVEATAEVLNEFTDAGGTLVSTADHYSGGRSEVMIGTWLRSLLDRSRVLVATKVGRHPDNPGLSARALVRAAEASLERLGTDYIDFLSFDGDHPETPADESLEAADRLIRAGKVRFLSASAYTGARLREFRSVAEPAAYPRFETALLEYNLMRREPAEGDVLPAARELGMGFFARLPLANGFLTGVMRTRDTVPESVMFAAAAQHIGRRGTRVISVLDEIAEQHDTTPGTVALAWVLSRPGVTAAIVRARDGEQLASLLPAARLTLTRNDVRRLDEVSAA